ncbi:sterol desaturase family protein [Crocosphaera sp.]|uniref:sterol desaturase family protein n=1 Tax=Crocosphaera sp. TaxID=2729996 RepID=UPI003F246284|nr:sterol desaturase family protein [Crocosphaera sp.]
MVSLVVFWLFFVATLLQVKQRQFLARKSYQDWLLDGLGLCVQGGGIPLLQILIGLHLYSWLLPDIKGSLELNPAISFLISFVGVDYLYYWHHRLLHHKFLFPVHAVHHTVTQMDMLGSSRNTLWSSFFLPYLWVNGFMLYVLNDVRGYSLGIFLTSFLDLWRHSSLNLPQQSMVYQLLNYCLILPKDHAYHHSRNKPANFAANCKMWDRLHGTYVDSHPQNQSLGIPLNMSLIQKLFYPFS